MKASAGYAINRDILNRFNALAVTIAANTAITADTKVGDRYTPKKSNSFGTGNIDKRILRTAPLATLAS